MDHATDKDGAELRIFVQPEGLGVCSLATFYGDSDEDWDRAQKALEFITQEKAESVAENIFKMAGATAR
jgi:hypothetical protein